jgi:hypothetical protein
MVDLLHPLLADLGLKMIGDILETSVVLLVHLSDLVLSRDKLTYSHVSSL